MQLIASKLGLDSTAQLLKKINSFRLKRPNLSLSSSNVNKSFNPSFPNFFPKFIQRIPIIGATTSQTMTVVGSIVLSWPAMGSWMMTTALKDNHFCVTGNTTLKDQAVYRRLMQKPRRKLKSNKNFRFLIRIIRGWNKIWYYLRKSDIIEKIFTFFDKNLTVLMKFWHFLIKIWYFLTQIWNFLLKIAIFEEILIFSKKKY